MKTSRRNSRIIIVQTLFEADFNGQTPDADVYMKIFNRIAKERNPILVDDQYAKEMLKGIVSKYEEINGIIEQASLHWTLDKIGSIDINILRLGVYEVIYGKELSIPGKVAINEALEITKLFLNDQAKKFVSGILGTIYNEVRDPNEPESVHKKIIIKKSVGAVVFRTDKKDEKLKFAFILDVFGKWTLSKSSLEYKEKLEDGVKRVINDELGLKVKPLEKIGENKYTAHPPEDQIIKKEVTYFLAETDDFEIKLKESGGLERAEWFSLEEAKKLTLYSDMKEIIYHGMARAGEISKK